MTEQQKKYWLVVKHRAILNRIKHGLTKEFNLDDPKHVSILFYHITGYHGNELVAKYYIDNRNEIDNLYQNILVEYREYINNFIPEIIEEYEYNGETFTTYSKPIDEYDFVKNKTTEYYERCND